MFAVLRDLAARSRHLGADAKRYHNQLAELVRSLDQTLLDEPGIGPISAAKLLACDPTRFKSEAAFARYNGTAPIPASSGKTVRYRLNPGGDRQANNAIHTIAIIRAKHQPETRAYLERPHQRRQDPTRGPTFTQAPHLPRALPPPRPHPLDFIEASLTGLISGRYWIWQEELD